jgi:hypothetical protein
VSQSWLLLSDCTVSKRELLLGAPERRELPSENPSAMRESICEESASKFVHAGKVSVHTEGTCETTRAPPTVSEPVCEDYEMHGPDHIVADVRQVTNSSVKEGRNEPLHPEPASMAEEDVPIR